MKPHSRTIWAGVGVFWLITCSEPRAGVLWSFEGDGGRFSLTLEETEAALDKLGSKYPFDAKSKKYSAAKK